MKKTVCFVLALIMLSSSGMSVLAANIVTTDIDKQLAPYIEVLDKINEELGSSLIIPEDAKESVYNAYKDFTLEEFETYIRQEYTNSSLGTENSPIRREGSVARYDSIDAEQAIDIGWNSLLVLNSNIYASGYPVVYTYNRINSIHARYPATHTGFHVVLLTKDYTLSSDRSTCTVYITFFLRDANGIEDLVHRSMTCTFYAQNY